MDREIVIDADKLKYKNQSGLSSSIVKLEKLQYAYAVVTDNNSSVLFLFDSHQHRIPIGIKGFSDVYDYLSQRFGFNDELFRATIKSNKPLKNRIWKRKYEQNFAIVDTELPIKKGIQVFDSNRTIVGWDLPLESLLKFEFINEFIDDYDQKSIQFLKPVQIGNIKINELKANIAYNNVKSPVIKFYYQLRNSQGDDHSYYIAKKSILNLAKKNTKKSNHEREDQNHFNFIEAEINISLTYWYDDKHTYESNYTSLYFTNLREYPLIKMNKDLATLKDIKEYLIFDCELYTPDRYRTNENIKEKPDFIKSVSKSNPCIWFNRTKKTIGFSGSLYSQEFNIDEIESIHLRNIYPARGSGSSNLELNLKQKGRPLYILRGSYQALDLYIPRIEKIIGLKILVEKEWADI